MRIGRKQTTEYTEKDSHSRSSVFSVASGGRYALGLRKRSRGIGTALQKLAPERARHQSGSVLIIVLWIAFGLVAITLYFANSMSLELRASENRVAAITADQAIEGAARYATYVLGMLGTNGAVPDYRIYFSQAVPVGNSLDPLANAHFWFIGRDHDHLFAPNQIFFGLVDEASKLNLNTAGTNLLQYLPRMTPQFMGAVIDWRDADNDVSENGAESQSYAMLHPPYFCKNTNFETTDELRLVLGASMELLAGEDLNRNGVLDLDEYDDNRNNLVDPGLLEYLTIYSREPNTGRTNINNLAQVAMLLQNFIGAQRANEILVRMGPQMTTGFRSPLEFYRRSGMTVEEFALVANFITVSSGNYIQGRINVNTASAAVLSCLPGITPDLAAQLVSYRQSNPGQLTSVAWLVEALGQNNAASIDLLQADDILTTQSYQFTADIAALGPYGRGYRRVRFVFDTCDGTPRIIYRQDLSHLGWALGKEARQTWLVRKDFKT